MNLRERDEEKAAMVSRHASTDSATTGQEENHHTMAGQWTKEIKVAMTWRQTEQALRRAQEPGTVVIIYHIHLNLK